MTGTRGLLSQDLGRLFEVAFNTGAVAALEEAHVPGEAGGVYEEDLRRWRFGKGVEAMLRGARVVDAGLEDVVRRSAEYLAIKGYLSGRLFLKEYLAMISRSRKKPELLYLGCDFEGNNLGQRMSPGSAERPARVRGLESLLERPVQEWEIAPYRAQGEFLKADLLALFAPKRRGQPHRVLSVDLSAFAGPALLDRNLADVESWRGILRREANDLHRKSAFSRLYLDTGRPQDDPASGTLAADLSDGLSRYLPAFKYRDKEFAKFVQAGSYSHSFYEFLLDKGRLAPDDRVVFTAVGYSDRGTASVSVGDTEREVLATCHRIYKSHLRQENPTTSRDRVLRVAARNARAAFEDGREFVKEILEAPNGPPGGEPGVREVRHRERISGFLRPQDAPDKSLLESLKLSEGITLRDAHAELVKRALSGEDFYLFLTGSPGIGKTTAIVEFLKERAGEGFLFFYASPRTQVNLDLLEKFFDGDPPEDLLCVTSNRQVVEQGAGGPTVEYRASGAAGERLHDGHKLGGVLFLDAATAEERHRLHRERLKRRDDRTLRADGAGGPGVLASVMGAAGAALAHDLSRRLVVAAALQSYRRTPSGDTLGHLDELFKSALSRGKPIPEKMRRLASRVRHIFVMVDEITGDPSGAAFLGKLKNRLEELGLTDGRYGFNVKVIVADASIVDKDVIRQHLEEAGSEPDKVFFRPSEGERANAPLEEASFRFRRLPARLVNANCYPAGALNVDYALFLETRALGSGTKSPKSKLPDRAFERIASDAAAALQEGKGQIIVYIQDKGRLALLIEDLKARIEGPFRKDLEYVEIHASLSASARKKVSEVKDGVRAVFMTSSASRGLSFKGVRRIFAEVPRFSLEQNLMEMVQVIYRGRGSDEVDALEKSLHLYLSESVFYDPGASPEAREAAIREGSLGFLSFLLVLKTSLMTRIFGSGRIGERRFVVVPVGGKALSVAATAFSDEISGFLRSLSSEIRRNPRQGHGLKKDVLGPVQNLFSGGRYLLGASPYLPLMREFKPIFIDRADRSLRHLLDAEKLRELPEAHLSGGLLIVPAPADAPMQEEYVLRAARSLGPNFLQALRKRLLAMRLDSDYPEDLRHKAGVVGEAVSRILEGEPEKTQRLTEETARVDRYYAVPVALFAFHEVFEEHFGRPHGTESPAREGLSEQPFRDLLALHAGALFPVEGLLPLGYEYQEFPFVIFNSYSLPELRGKLFAEKQLFASSELNVLNLILTGRQTEPLRQ